MLFEVLSWRHSLDFVQGCACRWSTGECGSVLCPVCVQFALCARAFVRVNVCVCVCVVCVNIYIYVSVCVCVYRKLNNCCYVRWAVEWCWPK